MSTAELLAELSELERRLSAATAALQGFDRLGDDDPRSYGSSAERDLRVGRDAVRAAIALIAPPARRP